jgi:hypothetical protein
LRFRSELSATGRGQSIEFRAAVALGLAPRCSEPTAFLEAVERGKERAGPDDVRAARDLEGATEVALRGAKFWATITLVFVGVDHARVERTDVDREL